MVKRLGSDFFSMDVLEVAPKILGKNLCVMFDGKIISSPITEVEAYRGGEDLACHASKGKTIRNSIMFEKGGFVYVYLIYGMYWMLNFVTGNENEPQAVLIRGLKGYKGPGVLTKALGINKSFYGENLETSNRIWIEDNKVNGKISTAKRIGIDYAGEYWKNVPWRYIFDLAT